MRGLSMRRLYWTSTPPSPSCTEKAHGMTAPLTERHKIVATAIGPGLQRARGWWKMVLEMMKTVANVCRSQTTIRSGDLSELRMSRGWLVCIGKAHE